MIRSMSAVLALVASLIASTPNLAAAAVQHFPPSGPLPPGMAASGVGPAFSGAVMAGDTLYISGTTDMDRTTGKPAVDATAGAKLVLDNIKTTVQGAGLTMDDLVWVQIFASSLGDYAAFNSVYRTYFTGPLPARAFIGAGSLLGGAHFEVMGVAVKAR